MRLHRFLFGRLLAAADRSLLSLNMKFGEKREVVCLSFRVHPADIQSLWECLGVHMYAMPTVHIRHVFDGGANIGFFTCIADHWVAPEQIIAVEPDPTNIQMLRRNTAHIGNRLRIIDGALSGTRGTKVFEVGDPNVGHLKGAPGHLPGGDQIKVIGFTIAEVFPSEWDPGKTWIKLDIEGAEYEVIADIIKWPVLPVLLSIELHDYLNAGGSDLVDQLRSLGYSVVVEGHGNSGTVCRQIHAVLPERTGR